MVVVLWVITIVISVITITPTHASSFNLSIKTTDNVIALEGTTNIEITVKNNSSVKSGNVYVDVITDITGVEVIKSDSSWGAFDINKYIWFIGNMEASQSAKLTLTLKGKHVGAHAITFRIYENDDSITQQTVYIGVEEEPDIDVTTITPKTINFSLGTQPYVELIAINRGGNTSGVKIAFQTDAGIYLTGKASCSQGTMAGYTWNIGPMIKGQTAKCLVQITAQREGTYQGTVKVITPTSDSNIGNNETSLIFNVKRTPNTIMYTYPINPLFTAGDNVYFTTLIMVKGPSPEKNLILHFNPTGGILEKQVISAGKYSDNVWSLGNVSPGIYFGIWKITPSEEKPVIVETTLSSDVTNIKRVITMSPKNVSDISIVLPDGKDDLDTAKSYPLPIIVLNKGTTIAQNITVNFNISGGSYKIIDATDGNVRGNTWSIEKLAPGSSASLYIDIINKEEGSVSVDASVVARTKTKDINPDNNRATWTGYFKDKGATAPPIVKKIAITGKKVQVLIVSPADRDLKSIWAEVDGREIYRFMANPGTSYLKTITLPSDGNFTINFYAEDTFGNNSTKASITATIDTTPPYTIWNVPQKGIINQLPFKVTGMTEPGAYVLIRVKAGNLREAYYQPDIDKEGKFSFNLYLFKGINEIYLFARDQAGNTYERCSVVSYPTSTVISFSTGQSIGYVNGKKYLLETPAVILNGTTYIPVRFLAEAMGIELGWYGMEKKIVLKLGETTLTLYLDKPYAIVNQKTINLGRKLPVIGGRSLVPARFIAETFGARVQWVPESKTVKIIYP